MNKLILRLGEYLDKLFCPHSYEIECRQIYSFEKEAWCKKLKCTQCGKTKHVKLRVVE